MEVETASEQETQNLGEKLAATLKAGNVVCLYGDLGAGKSVFVRGIAKGLGITKRILSPTFVIMRSYPGLLHLDLYRIDDFRSLGLDEIFDGKEIKVIEWAEKLGAAIPQKRIDVRIKKVNETTRKITITSPSVILRSEATKNLNKAVSILKSGGVVIFPTDTVYGIGCLFDNPEAVDRIYNIKNRPKNQPFPILVSSIEQVEKLAIISQQAKKLMSKYWPGGLTIILTPLPIPRLSTYSKPGLEQLGKSGKIGFRMPDSKLLQNTISQVGPIIGTSANFHGQKTPTSLEELDPELIKLVDYVVKGECKKGMESTVVDITSGRIKILRQGAIKL